MKYNATMKEFKTIAHKGEFEQTITKSTFIGRAYAVSDENDVQNCLKEQKKEFSDARHHTWAYILGENSMNMRYSDDGEPQGTAGQPMLEVIKKRGLTDVLVVVTRYFGGVLLGAGGLARAYSSTAVGALNSAGEAKYVYSREIAVELEYNVFSKNEKRIKQQIRIEKIEFGQRVKLICCVKIENIEEFENYFVQLSDGKAIFTKICEDFVLWENE